MSAATSTAPQPSGTKPKKNKGLNAGQGRLGLMLVAPTIAFLTLIIIYPLIKAIQLSFGKDQGLDPATGLFVEGGNAGLSNYTHWLLQKCGDVDCPPGTLGAQFYDALWVTLFFTVVSVVIEVLLGVLYVVWRARRNTGV